MGVRTIRAKSEILSTLIGALLLEPGGERAVELKVPKLSGSSSAVLKRGL
jgi:hypothetical protein